VSTEGEIPEAEKWKDVAKKMEDFYKEILEDK